MNILAKELNDVLGGSIADSFLSSRGKKLYFPKGIVAQSEEAKNKAKLHNATVGLATSNGQPMHLSDIFSVFCENTFLPSEIFNYAPGGGDKELRSFWKKDMLAKNPSLEGKLISESLVTSGLTHAINIVSTLFFDQGDELICPHLYWDNYDLIFSDLSGVSLKLFPFYKDGGFNTEAMKEAILSSEKECVRILLNFPNNPSGYTPSKIEKDSIVNALIDCANIGKKIMVISDDAYFGLFFEEETEKESLFASLADAHENIFAIKCDAATKEDMVWGFRIGFMTYASKGLTKVMLDALCKKTLGAIRCSVSNCDRPGQSLLLKAMKEGKNYKADKEKTLKEMNARYLILKETLDKIEPCKYLTPYPFNSGYFMSFDTNGKSAEDLRTYLLDNYQIGTINILNNTLRLAYCSVEKDKIEELVTLVFKAANELWN